MSTSTKNPIRVRLIRKVEWVPDASRPSCNICKADFTLRVRKHHCRLCGEVVCNNCSPEEVILKSTKRPVRACNNCYKIALENYTQMKNANRSKPESERRGQGGAAGSTGGGSGMGSGSIGSTGSSTSSSSSSSSSSLPRSTSARGTFAVDDDDGPIDTDRLAPLKLLGPSLALCLIALLLAATQHIHPATACGYGAWTMVVVVLVNRWTVSNQSRKAVTEIERVNPSTRLETISNSGDQGEVQYPPRYEAVLKARVQDVLDCVAKDDGDDGWKLAFTKKGVRGYIKKVAGQPDFIMGKGIVDAPLRAIMDFLLSPSVSVTQQLDPMFAQRDIIEQLNDFCTIERNAFKPVFPTTAREFLILTHVQIGRDGSGIQLATAVDHPSCPPNPNFVRGKVLVAGWHVQPLKGDKCLVTYVAQADLGGNVPAFLNNYVAAEQPMQIHALSKAIEKRDLSAYQPGGWRSKPLKNNEPGEWMVTSEHEARLKK